MQSWFSGGSSVSLVGTLWVDNSTATTGTRGSMTDTFQTIQDAVDASNPNAGDADTIFILKTGTPYAGFNANAGAGRKLHFKGVGQSMPLILSDNADDADTITLDNAHYSIEWLAIRNESQNTSPRKSPIKSNSSGRVNVSNCNIYCMEACEMNCSDMYFENTYIIKQSIVASAFPLFQTNGANKFQDCYLYQDAGHINYNHIGNQTTQFRNTTLEGGTIGFNGSTSGVADFESGIIFGVSQAVVAQRAISLRNLWLEASTTGAAITLGTQTGYNQVADCKIIAPLATNALSIGGVGNVALMQNLYSAANLSNIPLSPRLLGEAGNYFDASLVMNPDPNGLDRPHFENRF
jgi:hypothetical protein